jgi:hypothetical protein
LQPTPTAEGVATSGKRQAHRHFYAPCTSVQAASKNAPFPAAGKETRVFRQPNGTLDLAIPVSIIRNLAARSVRRSEKRKARSSAG